MMTHGTSYFPNLNAAIRYYAQYETGTRTEARNQAKHAVGRKLEEGQIHIGEPPLKAGETLRLIDGGTRYAITEGPTTAWERMLVSSETEAHLRGTHCLWSRLMDGEHIFTVLPNDKQPGPNDGGYRSIDAALKTKGFTA